MALAMKLLHILTVLLAASLLVSCSSNKGPIESTQGKDGRDEGNLFSLPNIFAKTDTNQSLELPPDLFATANDKVQANATETPSANELQKSALQKLGAGNTAGGQVLPEVVEASIQSNNEGRSWLRVNSDAEAVWRRVSEFWLVKGVELTNYQPESGLMETDWFVVDESLFSSDEKSKSSQFLNSFIAGRTALDKFSIRLQRREPNGTDVFISHRRREKISSSPHSGQRIVEYDWVEREQDAEKVAQLLQVIILLFRTDSKNANQSSAGDAEPA